MEILVINELIEPDHQLRAFFLSVYYALDNFDLFCYFPVVPFEQFLYVTMNF